MFELYVFSVALSDEIMFSSNMAPLTFPCVAGHAPAPREAAPYHNGVLSIMQSFFSKHELNYGQKVLLLWLEIYFLPEGVLFVSMLLDLSFFLH